MSQRGREGSCYADQAFQQMNAPRRHAIMIATLSELAITLTDAALSMFQSLVGRANLRARKRLEETIAASAEHGRVRLLRIAKDRKSGVEGKGVYVRVDLGGSRIIKKKKKK